MTLTCHPCNTKHGGSNLDSHASREADVIGFLAGDVRETKVELRTKSGIMPARPSSEGRQIKMFGVAKAPTAANMAAVRDDLNFAAPGKTFS